jgi:hypothetical protein
MVRSFEHHKGSRVFPEWLLKPVGRGGAERRESSGQELRPRIKSVCSTSWTHEGELGLTEEGCTEQGNTKSGGAVTIGWRI